MGNSWRQKVTSSIRQWGARAKYSQAELDRALLEGLATEDMEKIRWGLVHGANPDIEVPYAHTRYGHRHPLHIASGRGDIELIETLLNFGADMEVRDSHEQTPLFDALLYDEAGAVRSLITAGADLYARDNMGMTPDAYSWYGFYYMYDMEALDTYDYFKMLPRMRKGAEGLTHETLFKQNASRRCMLDNPATWHHLDIVLAALEAAGERLNYDDLQQTNKDGQTWQEVAIECRALHPLLKHVAAEGNPIDMLPLLDAEGKATPLLEAMAVKGQAKALFVMPYWQDKEVKQLKQLFNALPPDAQQEVPQYRALLMKLERNQSSEQQGRG